MINNIIGLPLEYCSQEYRNEVASKRRNEDQKVPRVLWKPKDPENTAMSRYRRHVNKKFSKSFTNTHQLQKWTVSSPHDFWIDLYEYTGIIPALPPNTKYAYDPNMKMRDLPPFFPGHKLNYAENVLIPNTAANPHAVALTNLRESQLDHPENVTWTELCELVRITRSALIRNGVKESDVIAAHMSNSIWIIVIFLASASIGAWFTSIAPDMGTSGCVSRLSQVKPKLLFTDTDHAVRGTRPSLLGKIKQLQQAVPDTKTIWVPTTPRPHLKRNYEYTRPLGITLYDFLLKARKSDKLEFTRVPTTHPLVVLYSSGTTGTPKCILSPHISILNYKKIGFLHNSLGPDSTVFQYSSTSWVVWNVMLGHLSVGARVVCYDGGALHPHPGTLLKICAQEKVTYWGTSPRYLLELEQVASKFNPQNYDLSHLRMVTTTGATLTGPQMRWFYTVFPASVHLSSIAGSTEIASSFAASDPAGPLHENEMQVWALGHDCDVADTETGQSIASTGEMGELVCRKPFASMPTGFWGDVNNRKYHESYFERFPLALKNNSGAGEPEYLDCWAQHDNIVRNPVTGGLQILSRSDSTLNPSGIRFGPSEIYSVISNSPTLNAKVGDSLCVGRKRKGIDQDEVVFLFVIAQKGHRVDDDLIGEIKAEIARGLSARHVPKFIYSMPDGSIPYTVNGKKVEVLVKKIISGDVRVVDRDGRTTVVGLDGKESGAVSTITHPECLKEYVKYKDVERDNSRRARL